jgi:hypothetical protein
MVMGQTNGSLENGDLHVNVSPKDVLKFKSVGFVRYSDWR